MAGYTITGSTPGTGGITGALTLAAALRGLAPGTGGAPGDVAASIFSLGVVGGIGGIPGMPGGTLTISGVASDAAAVTGSPGLSETVLSGLTIGTGVIDGDLVASEPVEASGEGYYEMTGIRPALPFLVYALASVGPADLVGLMPADGGSFLVSMAFVGGSGDPYFEAGAAPGYVGTQVVPDNGPPYFIFRPPVTNEVVWYVPTGSKANRGQTYWYNAPQVPGQVPGSPVWSLYRTMPERALAGTAVFTIFDPDGIYAYYARILGAISYQLGYDNNVLLNQFDPSLVSHFYLSSLAQQYGLTLNNNDTLQVQREKTANAVQTVKLKGLGAGIVLLLKSLGYVGYGNEVWINPTNIDNFQSAYVNPDDSPSSGPTGAGTDYKEYPHGYRRDDPTHTDGYFPSSRLSIHLNDAGGNPIAITPALQTYIAGELGALIPVFVDIRTWATDVAAVPDGEGVVVSDTVTVGAV